MLKSRCHIRTYDNIVNAANMYVKSWEMSFGK